MKKSLSVILLALMATILIPVVSAKTASQMRVYINPGHGSWTANDRPMSLISHPTYYISGTSTIDTCRFFESNTNLQKGFAILEECIKYGMTFNRNLNQSNSYDYKRGAAMDFSNNIVMSRVKNGPSAQYAGSSTSYNKNLSEIVAEVEANNFDFFISIHSNATGSPDSDGEYRSTFNRPIILFRGYTDTSTTASGLSTTLMAKSKALSVAANQYLLKDVHQNYSSMDLWVTGDISFYGSSSVNSYGYRGYLGALKHGCPGYLTEGYFHTYGPSRHRAMNWEVDHVEGWYYASAMADYFGLTKPYKGWIYGVVRDKAIASTHTYYTPRSGTNDVYRSLNGITVVLKQNGTVIDKKVTDDNYNGAYVFKDLAPGTYTVEYYNKNYVTSSTTVTVTAYNISYVTSFLTQGAGSDYVEQPATPPISLSLRHKYVDNELPGFYGHTIRRVVAHGNYVYVLGLNASNEPTIAVYNPDTQKIATFVSTSGMDGTQLKCSDIQVTSDGYLLACNKELTQCDDDHVEASDLRRGTFRIYKWAKDASGLPTGNPVCWLTSQYTGDWYRSYAGDTFAYSGSSTSGKAVFSCETTGSSRGIRTMVIPVSGGVMGTESYHQPYYQGLAANFSVTNFGDGYRFITNPANGDNYFVMGPGTNPVVECNFYHTNKSDVVAEMGSALSTSASGGAAVCHGGYTLLVNPNQVDHNTNGITITNITPGLNKAGTSTVSGWAIQSSWTDSSQAGVRSITKYKYDGSSLGTFMDIFLVRDNRITYMTTQLEEPDPAPYMVEKWNLSDAKGNYASKGWDATQVRNFCFDKGKLYCVYEQKDIKVINAATGDDLGNLNKAWVFGGTVRLADVAVCGGKIVASNIALTRNDDPLRLYCWDSDNDNPRVILDTRDFGGANRVGDYVSMKGTWESGEFLFCCDDGTTTRLLSYAVTNGVVATSPTVTILTTDGTTQLKTGISARVIPDTSGWWIDGRENPATYVRSTGIKSFNMKQDNLWSNDLQSFTYNGILYAFSTAYNGNSSDTSTGGRLRLYNLSSGWTDAAVVCDYPAAGLSASRTNGNGTGGLETYLHDGTVEAWVLATNQGLAYYVDSQGTPATFSVEPVKKIKPYLMSSRYSGNITAKPGVTCSLPITISGAFLSDHIYLTLEGDDAAYFSLNDDVVSINSQAETIYVSLNAYEERNYSARILCQSEGCDDYYVYITGNVTPETVTSDNIERLLERWIFSESRGNLSGASWFNTSDHPTRDIAVANYKLYVLNSANWDTDPQIAVCAAYGGNFNCWLRMEGVSGGLNPAASIRELGGHIIMSNAARAIGVDGSSVNDPLKVYKWYNDDCAPTLWMQDDSHGGIHVGEIMSVYGDMTFGKVMFSDGSKVLVYPVTYGHLSNSPQVITLTRGGSPYSVGDFRGAVSVTMLDDGSFWLTGKNCYPTYFAADGSFVEDFSAQAFTGELYGTSSSFFTIGSHRYLASASYLNTTQSWNKMTEGTMAIVDYTDGIAKASTNVVYPHEGLGSTNNAIYQTAVVTEKSTDGERLNLWIMVPQQGIAYYKFDAADSNLTTGVILPENPADDSAARYFNLQGVEMPAGNLRPGVYVKVVGVKATKVVIR